MASLLQRHLFAEIFRTSAASIALFVFLLLAGNALKDVAALLAAGQLTLGLFGRLLALNTPYVFAFALPLGLLTAILLVLGRMSARNEITALQASGLSLWRITTPILLFALMGTFLAIGINTLWAPEARNAYRNLLRDVVREDPLRFLVPGTFIHDFSGYVVYFRAQSETQLRDLWIWELNEDGAAINLVRAREGSIGYDSANDALVLTIRGGQTELRDPNEPDNLREYRLSPSFEETRLRLSLEQVLGERLTRKKLSHLTLPELLTARAEAVEEGDDPLRFQVQIQKLFSGGFGALSLALVGIPLAIRTGRSETYANATLALGLGMGFYMLGVVTSWAESYAWLYPQWLVWAPNLGFQALGLWLMLRREKV